MNARRFGIGSWIATGALAIVMLVGRHAGLRVNTSASAPSGLWYVSSIAEDKIERGMLVEVCPPAHPVVIALRDSGHFPSGPCTLNIVPFLKPVAAVAGDIVSIRQGQPVHINGQALAQTAAKPHLHPWPEGEYRVEPGTLWLLSGYSDNSLDSRYFGPIPISEVRAHATPLLTRGSMPVLPGTL